MNEYYLYWKYYYFMEMNRVCGHGSLLSAKKSARNLWHGSYPTGSFDIRFYQLIVPICGYSVTD